MKRLFTIIAVLVVVIGLGIAVYFLFFSSSAPHLTVGGSGIFDSSSATRTASSSISSGKISSGAGTLYAPGFIKITSDPVSAGTAVFDTISTSTVTVGTSTASTTQEGIPDIAVHYIDRASGNVYEYMVGHRSLTRIGDKTLPGIQQASWLPDGSMAFAQFLSSTDGSEHTETYALPATGTGGYFLQQDLAQASAMNENSIFTLAAGTNSSIGTVASADGTSAHTLFTSPLTSIQLLPSASGFFAVPKAANSMAGYVFAVNAAGTFTPIIGPLNGLTALPSPSGNMVLFSYEDGSNVMHMSVYNRTTGGVTEFPLATLAEKCAWTSDESSLYCAIPFQLTGTLPDDWYQGTVSFSDRIWRIDMTSHLATMVLDPESYKVSIDAVNLSMDAQAQALIFRNKKDSSLWALSI